MSLNARTPAVALLALVLSVSASGIARGAGVGQIAEFPAPGRRERPTSDRRGAHGNLWFTESAASKIGTINPAASVSPPTLSGVPQSGNSLTCQAGSWSAWAGQEPSAPFPYDGFSWLRDGLRIAGATGATYKLAAADAGQRVSCTQTLTYALVGTTVSAQQRIPRRRATAQRVAPQAVHLCNQRHAHDRLPRVGGRDMQWVGDAELSRDDQAQENNIRFRARRR
jgi:hypothetical protein